MGTGSASTRRYVIGPYTTRRRRRATHRRPGTVARHAGTARRLHRVSAVEDIADLTITFCFLPKPVSALTAPPVTPPCTSNSCVQTKAKYGDESVYFDLGDVEATTGSWDVYGVESKARYPDMQEKFFEQAATGLGRREAMYSFLALAGPAACLIFGGKGAKDANLPITVGPQNEAQLGPRDKL